MTVEPLIRDAVRAVILDRADRVLLVHFSFPDREFWATPGGGIEPGETHSQALARELGEEVGEVDISRAVPVWTRTHLFEFPGGWDGQRDTYYLIRVDDLQLRPRLDDEALRSEGVTAAAWWTMPELDASRAHFSPTRLPELVAVLLCDGAPELPVDVGE